jgi:hypothetical protein
MIKGATLLMSGIPGRFLDPFHLADSQGDRFPGYILIGYEIDRRQWDMLILRGQTIIECARIDEHHRQRVELKEVEERFHSAPFRDRSRLFLFEIPPVRMDPFLRTLSAVPTLKVQVDPLSREQLVRLIRNSQATSLIAERSVMQPLFPLYEFLEIKSPHQPIEFQVRFRKGLLLLYSLEAQGENGSQLGLGFPGDGREAGEKADEVVKDTFLLPFWQKFVNEAAGYLKGKEVLTEGERILRGGEAREIFALISRIVGEVGAFRRPLFRRKVLSLLAEFYNEEYNALKERALLPALEACHRELKR